MLRSAIPFLLLLGASSKKKIHQAKPAPTGQIFVCLSRMYSQLQDNTALKINFQLESTCKIGFTSWLENAAKRSWHMVINGAKDLIAMMNYYLITIMKRVL
jgi:hypothetical protein